MTRYIYDDDGVPQYPAGMGEMAFEAPVRARVVRNWFTPAYRRWNRMVYGRGGWFIAWGCLLWFFVIPLITIKAVVFWGVVAVMLVIFLLTAICDLATYRWRRAH